MDIKHVVVDGSNIATEGRSLPSLAQLDEAVRAFLEENPTEQLTVIVDATFGHRIDPSEKDDFEAALAANELITPPAGAIGRGDAFVLQIANRADAVILSNDSFQEFHGQYTWLFDEGRLVGGKPVPGVGWVFLLRTPGARTRQPALGARGRVGSQERARRARRHPVTRSRPGVATPSPTERGRRRPFVPARGAAAPSPAPAALPRRSPPRRPARVPVPRSGSGRDESTAAEVAAVEPINSSRSPSSSSSQTTRSARPSRAPSIKFRVARRVRRGIRRSLLRAAQGDGRSRTQERAATSCPSARPGRSPSRRSTRRRRGIDVALVPDSRQGPLAARRRCRRRRLEHRHADALDHRWSRHGAPVAQRPTTDAPIDAAKRRRHHRTGTPRHSESQHIACHRWYNFNK